MKRDIQTHRQTHRRTSRLYDRIGPVGRFDAIYLETGQVPIRYILACRRILYLQNILQRNDNELVKKVYLAQKADTSEGDFCQLVDSDLQLIDLQMSNDQISGMSSFDLKKLVKIKAGQAAFKDLLAIKETK